VLFDGTDVTRLGASALGGFRRRVQMVFQDPLGSLNPRATIRTLLRRPAARQPGASRRRAAPQVERLASASAGPGFCSTAIRTRSPAGSASASASPGRSRCRPDLIVCDEPVSSLDVSIRAQIVNLLLDLRRDSGVALLFISHDLALVRASPTASR